jgi:hypothetical protein
VKIEKPKRATRSYVQKLIAEPARVFPLLCPVREAEWIEGWDPDVVMSESGVAELDCVFITPSPRPTYWMITRYEPNVLVEMVRFTPGLTACKLDIQLTATERGTQARVSYAHTSLGADGDAFVEAFTEELYERSMRDWEARLNHYLATGKLLRA